MVKADRRGGRKGRNRREGEKDSKGKGWEGHNEYVSQAHCTSEPIPCIDTGALSTEHGAVLTEFSTTLKLRDSPVFWYSNFVFSHICPFDNRRSKVDN